MKKKVITFIVLLSLGVLLSACGKKEGMPVAQEDIEDMTSEEISEEQYNDALEAEPAEEADEALEAMEEDGNQLISWRNYDIRDAVQHELHHEDITIDEAKSVTELHFDTDNKDMKDLHYLSGVKILGIGCVDLDDLSFVNDMPELEELNVYSERLTSFDSITNHDKIKKFKLRTYGLETLNGISNWHNLEILDIQTDILSDISDASGLESLEEIEIVSNTLKNPNIDMSKMSKLNDVNFGTKSIINNTDFFATIPVIILPENKEHFIFQCLLSSELSDDELNKAAEIIAEKQYDLEYENNRNQILELAIGLPREDKRSFHNIYAKAYNNLIERKGSPIHANIETIDQTTNVKVPDNWDEMTFALGGQIITLSTSVTPQTYLDYGFTLLNGNINYSDYFKFTTAYKDIKLDDMLAPRKNSDAFQMINTDTGAVVGLRVRNLSEERACELRDCSVISVTVIKDVYHKIGSKDSKKERQPELVLPTNEAYIQKQKENIESKITYQGNQSYLTFGSWDSDRYYAQAFDFDFDDIKHVVKEGLDAEIAIGFGDEGIDIIELRFYF